MWRTNYGGLAYSDDGGSTWVRDPYAVWDNIFGLSKFQVSAMVPHEGYVYMFGTPNSRLGAVALARVRDTDVLNKTAYQYWNGGRWIPATDPNVAQTLFSAPVGESSVRYDAARHRWQMTYLDVVRGQILLREATEPQGVWSAPVPLVSSAQYPQLYGGFMHPWSNGRDLYFTMSSWVTYNVELMRVRLN